MKVFSIHKRDILYNKDVLWGIQVTDVAGRFSKEYLIDENEFYSIGRFIYETQKKHHRGKKFIYGAHDIGYHSKYLPNLTEYPQWMGCQAGISLIGIERNRIALAHADLNKPEDYVKTVNSYVSEMDKLGPINRTPEMTAKIQDFFDTLKNPRARWVLGASLRRPWETSYPADQRNAMAYDETLSDVLVEEFTGHICDAAVDCFGLGEGSYPVDHKADPGVRIVHCKGFDDRIRVRYSRNVGRGNEKHLRSRVEEDQGLRRGPLGQRFPKIAFVLQAQHPH